MWAPAAGTNFPNMTFPLCQLPIGSVGRIQILNGDSDFCQRLRELGLGESSLITKVGGTGPFLCQINGTRIALGYAAAAQIVVAPFQN